MADFKPSEPLGKRRRDEPFEFGGLRFVVSSNDYGANLGVFGDAGKGRVELIRFQDYVDDPHYHVPVGGWHAFDRAVLGEPLAWWLARLRDDLPAWMAECGFGELMPAIDFDAVRANLDTLNDAMIGCVPDGWERVPGCGLRRVDWTADQSAFYKRNERVLEFGGLRFEVFFDRDLGASMQVFARAADTTVEMIRLDDYEEHPHYHAPVGVWFGFDRDQLGEPLRWFIDQVEQHLPALLERARVPLLIPQLDFAEISANAGVLYAAMAARVPRGCARIPGVGLQRVEPAATS
jgi:hypothetical protein